MDAWDNYRQLVKQALQNYAAILAPFKRPYELVLIFDDEHAHYLAMKLGWHDGRRINHTVLHLAIHQGKIHIEEDWTEEGIATYLLEHGTPKEDIVLAFHPPEMRPYTEFAAA